MPFTPSGSKHHTPPSDLISRNTAMAIYSAVPPPPEYAAPPTNNPPAGTPPAQNQSATGIDIDAWTISALQSLSVSPVARGTGTPLAIPIDDNEQATSTTRTVTFTDANVRVETPRRPSSRRDSLKRREALLKGKEGSRQRRRWENGKPTLGLGLDIL